MRSAVCTGIGEGALEEALESCEGERGCNGEAGLYQECPYERADRGYWQWRGARPKP